MKRSLVLLLLLPVSAGASPIRANTSGTGVYQGNELVLGALVVLVLVAHPIAIWIVLGAGIAVFGACFYLFREAFKKRSGGVGFR